MAISITLRMKFLNLDGTPKTGTVTFTLSAPLYDLDGNEIWSGAKLVTLENGIGLAALPATKGDPDVSPLGLVYHVRELLDGDDERTYDIELDAALGFDQQLSSLGEAVDQAVFTYALVADLATHVAKTTAVHGIADTGQLATTAYVDAHAATPAWGDIEGTLDEQDDLVAALEQKAELSDLTTLDADLATHEAATANVHGILDTSQLATLTALAVKMDATTLDIQGLIVQGAAAVASNVLPPGAILPHATTLTGLRLRVGSAPLGAALIVAFRLDNVLLGSVTVAAGAVSGSTDINVEASAGQILTWDVTQIGSTSSGADLWARVIGA